MSKPYREADLSDQFAQDRNWRIREVSDLKTAILRADEGLIPTAVNVDSSNICGGWYARRVGRRRRAKRDSYQRSFFMTVGIRKVLLRALVAICYAHWEGSVRFSSRKDLEHIALRKLTYSQLDRQFLRNYFLPRLASSSSGRISVGERCDLIDDILNASDRRFSKVNDDIVNTRSNLKFDVFADICRICGVPVDQFLGQAQFVDLVLVKRRNAIAHGEETLADMDELNTLTQQTVGLMRAFGDALENRIYQRSFLAA